MASSLTAELKRKAVSAEQAVDTVASGNWVDYGFGVGQPDLLDKALAARVNQLQNVKLRGTLALRPRAVIEADPDARHITYLSWYFSGLERRMHDRGLCHHIPMNFGEAPDYYRRFVDVDVALFKTAPMDAHGFFNFGGAISYQKALTEKARRIVVETDGEVTPFACHARPDDLGLVATDEVDGHVGAAPVRPGIHLVEEVAPCGVVDGRRAQFGAQSGLFGPTGKGDHLGSRRDAELDDRRPDRTRPSDDEQRLAGSQLCALV